MAVVALSKKTIVGIGRSPLEGLKVLTNAALASTGIKSELAEARLVRGLGDVVKGEMNDAVRSADALCRLSRLPRCPEAAALALFKRARPTT